MEKICRKEFIKEFAELINKHGLEKEMKDTPGYILAEKIRKEAENETR